MLWGDASELWNRGWELLGSLTFIGLMVVGLFVLIKVLTAKPGSTRGQSRPARRPPRRDEDLPPERSTRRQRPDDDEPPSVIPVE